MTNKEYKFLLKFALKELKEWQKFIILLEKEYAKEYTKTKNKK